jgi:hypothetical protein
MNTTIKSILNSLEDLHQSLMIQSGSKHAKTLKEFNKLVVKANKVLREEKYTDGTPVWKKDLNGYELLDLNQYINS